MTSRNQSLILTGELSIDIGIIIIGLIALYLSCHPNQAVNPPVAKQHQGYRPLPKVS